MWSNLMKILTNDAIHDNESDMLRFVFTFKERVKIGQENWFRRFLSRFFRGFLFTPSYALSVTSEFLPNERCH